MIDHVQDLELKVVKPKLVGRFQLRPFKGWDLLVFDHFTISTVFMQFFDHFYLLVNHLFVFFVQFFVLFVLRTVAAIHLVHEIVEGLFAFENEFIDCI